MKKLLTILLLATALISCEKREQSYIPQPLELDSIPKPIVLSGYEYVNRQTMTLTNDVGIAKSISRVDLFYGFEATDSNTTFVNYEGEKNQKAVNNFLNLDNVQPVDRVFHLVEKDWFIVVRENRSNLLIQLDEFDYDNQQYYVRFYRIY